MGFRLCGMRSAGREGWSRMTEHVVEHALGMSSGAMQVRWNHPEVERIYPLDQWIVHQQRHGGKVWRRTIIVVDDWAEVPKQEELS